MKKFIYNFAWWLLIIMAICGICYGLFTTLCGDVIEVLCGITMTLCGYTLGWGTVNDRWREMQKLYNWAYQDKEDS